MGYCFGGLCVLDMARIGANVRGVASFHGLFNPPGNTAGNKITAKVLALHGHHDPMVPVDQVNAFEQEMIEAGADFLFPGVVRRAGLLAPRRPIDPVAYPESLNCLLLSMPDGFRRSRIFTLTLFPDRAILYKPGA